MKTLLLRFSHFPSKAKPYLKVMIKNQKDLQDFLNIYNHESKGIFFCMAKFREEKRKRQCISFEYFTQLYARDKAKAIEQLFLYPHSLAVHESLIEPIENELINLKEVYDFSLENPLYNSVIAGKILLN